MSQYCFGRSCIILAGTWEMAGSLQKNLRLSLLSAEGKILSAIMQNDNLIMKDLPHITGISFRSCFDCVRDLSERGIVEKVQDARDKRAVILKLNRKKLCEAVHPIEVERENCIYLRT